MKKIVKSDFLHSAELCSSINSNSFKSQISEHLKKDLSFLGKFRGKMLQTTNINFIFRNFVRPKEASTGNLQNQLINQIIVNFIYYIVGDFIIMDPKWTSGNELKYLKEVLNNSESVRNSAFTDRLEQEFKKKFKTKYAIAVNSGASGLHAAMHAAGVKTGDEIITSPFSVLWDAGIAIIMGAKVIFADIKYGTHNIDPKKQRN